MCRVKPAYGTTCGESPPAIEEKSCLKLLQLQNALNYDKNRSVLELWFNLIGRIKYLIFTKKQSRFSNCAH